MHLNKQKWAFLFATFIPNKKSSKKKGKPSESITCMVKTTASVLLKLFIKYTYFYKEIDRMYTYVGISNYKIQPNVQ